MNTVKEYEMTEEKREPLIKNGKEWVAAGWKSDKTGSLTTYGMDKFGGKNLLCIADNDEESDAQYTLYLSKLPNMEGKMKYDSANYDQVGKLYTKETKFGHLLGSTRLSVEGFKDLQFTFFQAKPEKKYAYNVWLDVEPWKKEETEGQTAGGSPAKTADASAGYPGFPADVPVEF